MADWKEVRILKDSWIPREFFFRIITPRPATWDMEATVDHLICPVTRQGDQALLDDVFNAEEVAQIQSIPLSCQFTSDRIIWYHEKNCRFSVRSACHVA